MIGDTLTVTVCEDRLVARDHLVEGDCTDDGDCTDGKDHTDDGKDHTDDGDCTDGKDHTDDGDCTDEKDHTDDGDCTDEKDHTDYGEHTLDGQQFAHEQDLFIKDGRKVCVWCVLENGRLEGLQEGASGWLYKELPFSRMSVIGPCVLRCVSR